MDGKLKNSIVWHFYRLRKFCKNVETPKDELIRGVLSIHLVFISIFIDVIFILVDLYYKFYRNVAIDFLVLTILLFTYVGLRRGYFTFSKLFLITLINASIFFDASIHGREAGFQYIWFIILGAIFLIFSLNQIKAALAGILISFLFFGLTEITDFQLFKNLMKVDPQVAVMKYYISLITAIFMTLFFLFYYMQLYLYSQRKLNSFIRKLNLRNNSLQKTNRELDSFVYKASHDLRAPLSSLMALVKLSKEESDHNMLKEYIQHQEKAIKKLDTYIVDILNISKNARKELEVVPIDLKELIDDVLSQYSFLTYYEETEKLIEIQEDLPLYSDKKRLKVVLNNLISNSLRYSDPSKKLKILEIRIESNKLWCSIIIKDNGVGIPKKHLKNIFEMFYRASHSSEGSGLGLYIVHETVSKLGGSISVNSEELEWTEFNIMLPNYIQRKS